MKTAKCGASNPASGSAKKKAKGYAYGGMPMNPKKKATMGGGGYAKKKK
tara:strand:- start:164 stop:310 length:147 start_codon:yes stop_codon:yes gene_type:complete